MIEEKFDIVKDFLENKSATKQEVYRITLDIFAEMRRLAKEIVNKINNEVELKKGVSVEYTNFSEFEFHIRLSGELVVFSIHSNIVTFPATHLLSTSNYIKEDENRRYFGTFTVYNFLNDSLRYNRLNDVGYLLARLFVNRERHFYIEGVRQMHFLYPDIAQNILDQDILSEFIYSVIEAALENDSITADFESNKIISVGEKLSRRMLGGVQKVGYIRAAPDGGLPLSSL